MERKWNVDVFEIFYLVLPPSDDAETCKGRGNAYVI